MVSRNDHGHGQLNFVLQLYPEMGYLCTSILQCRFVTRNRAGRCTCGKILFLNESMPKDLSNRSQIKLAEQNNIPFLATGGRHGYSTTLGNIQGGLAIDLSKLNSIVIDTDLDQLTIGPGVRFRDIFEPLYQAGYQIRKHSRSLRYFVADFFLTIFAETGTCSCVGMMGATLGGGIGRSHGIHGMIIDALVSVRLLTADGNIIEASEDCNPDLFWGIRGAGQNFGIVLTATYNLHPLYKGGVWTSADILLTPEKNVSFFETVAQMQPLPPQLTVETIMNYNTTLEQVSPRSSRITKPAN